MRLLYSFIQLICLTTSTIKACMATPGGSGTTLPQTTTMSMTSTATPATSPTTPVTASSVITPQQPDCISCGDPPLTLRCPSSNDLCIGGSIETIEKGTDAENCRTIVCKSEGGYDSYLLTEANGDSELIDKLSCDYTGSWGYISKDGMSPLPVGAGKLTCV